MPNQHVPWPRYYWLLCKHFGSECYKTWRWELFASVLVIVFTAVITGDWKDFRTALLATGLTLGCFVIGHFVRVPFLLQKAQTSPEESEPSFLAGMFGALVIAGIFMGGYELGVAVWHARPLGAIETHFSSADPGAKDAVIKQLQQEIKSIQRTQQVVVKERLNPPSETVSAVKGEPQIRVSRLPLQPTPQYGKLATEFILTTTTVMNGGRVSIHCDNKINKGQAVLAGASVLMGGSSLQDEHTFLTGIDAPNWSPSMPLVVTLFFDEPDLGKCTITPF